MKKGRYGKHGGQYIPETLMNAVLELEKAYEYYKEDTEFQNENFKVVIRIRPPLTRELIPGLTFQPAVNFWIILDSSIN